MSGGTLLQALEHGAAKDPALVVPGGRQLSHGQLREQVSLAADRLAQHGLGRGDRIAMVLPNGAEAVLLEASGMTDPSRTAGNPHGDDIALVLHTSGTTSRPKLVPLRHRNLAASIDNIAATYELGSDDVALCVMPLFHIHGLMASVMATLRSGGTVVIPQRFDPMGFWPVAEEQRATWYSAVPTIHQLLLMRNRGERPAGASRLRFIRSSSSALSPETMRLLEERFGAPVLEAYGMTEASHQMASNPLPPGDRRPGTVGRGTGVEIGIMDEEGSLLDGGSAGEVVIRGPSVIDGYADNPEANAAAFTEGWFRTGDQGVLDPDGYLALVGRLKEMINRGGEKIAPREIDEVLLQHPAVGEAVAFGSPHPAWGEEVAAAVVLKEPVDEKELLAFARERLADYKVPSKLYIVDAIPRTATGKIQRRSVAEVLTSR
jgi:acyl-CoA synthetase (AMP-forming)/AMP-acid ligase II